MGRSLKQGVFGLIIELGERRLDDTIRQQSLAQLHADLSTTCALALTQGACHGARKTCVVKVQTALEFEQHSINVIGVMTELLQLAPQFTA